MHWGGVEAVAAALTVWPEGQVGADAEQLPSSASKNVTAQTIQGWSLKVASQVRQCVPPAIEMRE